MKVTKNEFIRTLKLWVLLLLVLTCIGVSVELLMRLLTSMRFSEPSGWWVSLLWVLLLGFSSVSLTIISLEVEEIKNWLKTQFGLKLD